MKPIEEVRRLFEENDGILRTKDLYTRKVYYDDLQQYVKDGVIDKVRYGYYKINNEKTLSEAWVINMLFPDAILNMDTALYYYRYSDRIPSAWHLAVSKDSGKTRFKIEHPFIRPFYLEPSLLELGLAFADIDGNKMRIYDKERAICDCLKYRNKMDREIFTKAIQNYVNDPSKNIRRLMQYAKKMRVTNAVKNIVGVWI